MTYLKSFSHSTLLFAVLFLINFAFAHPAAQAPTPTPSGPSASATSPLILNIGVGDSGMYTEATEVPVKRHSHARAHRRGTRR